MFEGPADQSSPFESTKKAFCVCDHGGQTRKSEPMNGAVLSIDTADSSFSYDAIWKENKDFYFLDFFIGGIKRFEFMMRGDIINFIMSNFYTDEDQPLRKVK